MSRDIKFRVWDHKHKTMGRVIGWSRYELLEEIGNVVYYVNDKTSLQPTDSERIEIMQYTGLKDKNGVEIYEGDVLSYYLGSDYHIGEVKYDIDRFAIYWFRCSNILNRSCKNIYKRSKVIGNIYENPELLEE